MLTKHDQEIFDYMKEKHNGMCAYHTIKKCNGMCNNCPYDLPNHGIVKYSPCGAIKCNCQIDYEEAILARQETYYND